MSSVAKQNEVMLIDDDYFIARAYKDGFEKQKFKVILASDGQEALSRLKEEHPDLIILDLIMPRMSGFDFMEEIRKKKDLGKIPVMVFSNLSQASDIKRAKDLGAVEYLVKTDHSMKEVVQIVNNLINKR